MSNVTAVPLQPVKRAYVLWLIAGVLLAWIAGAALAQVGGTGVSTTASGLRYQVLKQGAGARPTDADVVLVNYEGKLPNGDVFDKSQQPTPFPVTAVVPGFSEGLKLMNKGARYRFWIPPQLGYGDRPSGPIPPNSTLTFDVELVDFLPEATVRAMQQQQMMGGAPGALPPGAVPPGGAR
jgi:FKBP-type peptidyl-prolyl cis-trans isomerase FkpA